MTLRVKWDLIEFLTNFGITHMGLSLPVCLVSFLPFSLHLLADFERPFDPRLAL